ncbi:pentatricopeptide repeat-containing protein At2g45350, chloroplastic-like [Dioscorea cayenensis subsp. rotundata]|uniref:Pentatricopeptide repeat-containing protein At2g45350, chloroplastic-like n=1 Tax=Dioscorea cayennensis subsp. rotundata TaxID=55577 RepID=A0AB40AWD7_DIOCR|nr:pentatricopeptide repeat-containing protein At2g45350, chloroplastic-like [Dioscorea cayenensis subsp. rotundata]
MDEALELFDKVPERDVIAWASVIKGHMDARNVSSGGVCLMKCRRGIHRGLVKEGLACFKSLIKDYKLEPKVQHYGCMADILGCVGLLKETVRLIKAMRVQPNDVVWRSLLSACRNHGNIEIGKKVVTSMIECDNCRSSSYVLLSNLYAGCCMWEDATRIRMTMKEGDFRKLPGCSWIKLDGIIHDGINSPSSSTDLFHSFEFLYS